MSGRKGMLHYREEVKKEAVRLVLDDHLSYKEVAVRLGIRKAGSEQSELERLGMENALLKKFHSELRELQLGQRNIGRSTTTKKSSK